jgi:hypothetical protein
MIQNWTDAVKETFTFNSHQSEQEFLFSFKNLNSSFVVIKNHHYRVGTLVSKTFEMW